MIIVTEDNKKSLKIPKVRLFEFLIAWSVKTWWGDHLFLRGGLKYFDPELVDSFVENINSDIKVICSDFLHTWAKKICLN